MARNFAEQLLDLLDEHGYWDDHQDVDEAFRSKRVRRTGDTLHLVEKQILDALGSYSEAVAISVVADALGLSSRSIAHPLTRLVEQGDVERQGERRGARYRLVRPKRPSKRPPRPKAKKTPGAKADRTKQASAKRVRPKPVVKQASRGSATKGSSRRKRR